jgi:hypothetical protein
MHGLGLLGLGGLTQLTGTHKTACAHALVQHHHVWLQWLPCRAKII